MADRKGCKVDRTIDRYELSPPGGQFETLDAYLVARWTGETGGESVGYKGLTDWFNKRLLKHVYERHGRSTLGTRLDSEYDALTGDKELLRGEVVDDLAADGIDAETVQRDMVSWSTMRRHLKECLDAEKQTREATSDWEVQSVEIAKDRLETKTGEALRSLDSKDKLPEATKAAVDIQVKLSCPECPTRVPLEDALNRGYICETHFETSDSESESGETIRLSDKIGLLIMIGLSTSLLTQFGAIMYHLTELSGIDIPSVTLEIGANLAL
ncbi:MAG: rod-determining factor RdfA [Halorientalis sp.]